MTDNTELKRAAERIVEVQTSQDVPVGILFDEFEALASPEAILALIAENEALKGPHDWLAEDLIKELVDNAASFQENSDEGESDPFAIVLLAAASRIRRQEANIVQLKAENEALLAALKGMTSMYGYCWDIVDGGLLCMQDNVQRFEDAHEAAQKVIGAMVKGEQL